MNCPECNGPTTRAGDTLFRRNDEDGTKEEVAPVYECKPCELQFAVISHGRPLV